MSDDDEPILQRRRSKNQTRPQRIPGIFLGHGNPMNALYQNISIDTRSQMGKSPKAARDTLYLNVNVSNCPVLYRASRSYSRSLRYKVDGEIPRSSAVFPRCHPVFSRALIICCLST